MPCVLVVEDDDDIREMLKYLLTANGYDTMFACNGREALVRMSERTPCVVLLDMHMPVMNGWEFRACQLGDPTNASVPVIAVTAYYDPRTVEQQLGLKCLHKPLSVDHIIDEVQRACGGSRD